MASRLTKTEESLAPGRHYLVALILFFTSGAAGLIYEVLWMKELGLLFGNTAYAAATTLAVFFLGLAVGGQYWGQRVSRHPNPVRTYAWLELAVAVSAAGYFLLLSAYRQVYALAFGLGQNSFALFLAVKFVLAVAILFPPAFFMGGTLPAISQFVARDAHAVGRRVSLLYAVNTLGAATGTFAAAFLLVPLLGFTMTYATSMGLTLGVALVALVLGQGTSVAGAARVRTPPRPAPVPGELLSLSTVRVLSFASGAITLALQVLWVRMFAQVLQNSVYTFSIVLAIFLLGLGAGAGLLRWLLGRGLSPLTLLTLVLVVSGLSVALSPLVFAWWTDGLSYFGGNLDWADYVQAVFLFSGLILGVPVLAMGMLFPLLLQLGSAHYRATGSLVGHLLALNTIGGILGSLLAGFVLLDLLGLWSAIGLMAVIYLVSALLVTYRRAVPGWQVWVPAIGLILLASVLDTARLPVVKLYPRQLDDSLLQVWEGSAGTVSVIRRGNSRILKFNSHHTLGGTAGRVGEAFWGHLPVELHRQARSVFLLGMGTGITAGAVLRHPVERVVVSELVPDVVTASREYFHDYLNGLFEDPRASVVVEDARNYLLGTRESFDVIVSDLFIPWESGAGSLYTLEHYRTLRERLNPGGLFMQWLPLAQVSRHEFDIVARTLMAVFPEVTVWRSDFSAGATTLGLLARPQARPLSVEVPLLRLRGDRVARSQGQERILPLAYYCGNLSRSPGLVGDGPVNTDDRPLIEYQAPLTQRGQRAQRASWLTGSELIGFLEALQAGSPAAADPFLAGLPDALRRQPAAGFQLHRYRVLEQAGDARAAAALAEYQRILAGEG